MPKFKKKPVVIEAMKFLSPYITLFDDLVIMAKYEGIIPTPCKHCGAHLRTHGVIETLEGEHIVCPGDMIIKGVEGEYYPCKPNIFEKTYEPILDT